MANAKKPPTEEEEIHQGEIESDEAEPSPEELRDEIATDADLKLPVSDEEDHEPVGTGLLPKERSIARTDPLAVYMSEIKRYPLLTREEEHELAVKYTKTGDVVAARRLVTANLRLVVKIAHEYRRAHRNLLDLIQEGNVGLLQAVKKYDPYRGVKLSSYAAWWIRAYMLKFILNNWRLVKIGTTQAQRKLFFNLRKEREKLEQLGFQPTAALLAEKLDVPEKEVVEMERRLAAPEASLDAPVGSGGDDEGTRTRLDFLPSEDVRRSEER